MALINCPECNKEISDKVESCPHCGYPLVKTKPKNSSLTNFTAKILEKKKTAIISLLILLSIVAILTVSIIKINSAKTEKIKKSNLEKIEKENAEINTLLKDSLSVISTAGTNASNTCSIILDVWSNAKSRDFNEVFKYMFSGDIKNHEWSGLGMDNEGFSTFSWGSRAKDMNSFKNRLNDLKSEKSTVDSKLDHIKQIKKDGYDKEIDAVVSYYNSYLKLYNAATSPSGNQLNYSSNLVTMDSEFNSNKVKLEMLIKLTYILLF